MDAPNKASEWFFGLQGPMQGEELIKEDVKYDSSKTSSLGNQQATDLHEFSMCVAEAVKFALHEDPRNALGRVMFCQRSGSPPDGITQQSANSRGFCWSGEVQMRKIVYGLRTASEIR